jgi:hypothetical protein
MQQTTISRRKIDDALLAEKHATGMTQTALAEFFGSISRRLKRMTPTPADIALEALTPKRAAFVKAVAVDGLSPTKAALASHDCSSADSGKSLGRKLMEDEEIRMTIEQLTNSIGLTRPYRMKKLFQHCEHPEAGLSLKALELAMKACGDMAPQQIEVYSTFDIRALIASIPGKVD